MKRFILTERNGIYIIDLQQTIADIDIAFDFVKQTVPQRHSARRRKSRPRGRGRAGPARRHLREPPLARRHALLLPPLRPVCSAWKELEQIDFDDVASSVTQEGTAHDASRRRTSSRAPGRHPHDMTKGFPRPCGHVDLEEHPAVLGLASCASRSSPSWTPTLIRTRSTTVSPAATTLSASRCSTHVIADAPSPRA